MNQHHPSVVIPGFMKAGTTNLHTWISSQPEFCSDGPKEPNHLVAEYWNSAKADEYFREIGAVRGQTVDASVRYLDPDFSSVFAKRLVGLNPYPRIIVGYRCPLERSISHVLHDTRKGRISAQSAEEYSALIRPDSIYFRRSMYGRAVRPLMEYFPAAQIAVIPIEVDDYTKWSVIFASPQYSRQTRS